MRNVIQYFLLLFICFHVTAFQPPEKPKPLSKKMEISPQEFEAQAKPGSTSYLSLLPADIRRKVGTLAYPGIENEITAIREKGEHLINEQTILELADRYGVLPNDVAIMLNTPYSVSYEFGLLTDPASGCYGFINNIYKSVRILQAYLQNAALDYPQAIAYIKQFISNIKRCNEICKSQKIYTPEELTKAQDYALQALIATILNKFEKQFSAQRKPVLEVILDSDSSLVSDLLKANTQENNPLITHYIRKNKFWSEANGLKAFQKQLIEEWGALLLDALKNQDTKKIIVLGKGIWKSRKNNNPLVTEYFKAQIKTPLINYLLNAENIDAFGDFYTQDVLYDLLLDAIKNERATSEKILRWMNVAQIDLDFKSAMPSKKDLEGALAARGSNNQGGFYVMYGSMFINQYERALEMQKYGIELLLAVASYSRMNGDVLHYLLAHGADANGADEQGITILMHAIKNKHFDMAAVLLNQPGINVNACDNNGWETALSNAQFLPDCEQKDILIATLKERGAQEPGICVIQ